MNVRSLRATMILLTMQVACLEPSGTEKRDGGGTGSQELTGDQLYQANCSAASCHPDSSDLKKSSQAAAKAATQSAIETVSVMSGLRSLSDSDLNKIAAYIQQD